MQKLNTIKEWFKTLNSLQRTILVAAAMVAITAVLTACIIHNDQIGRAHV